MQVLNQVGIFQGILCLGAEFRAGGETSALPCGAPDLELQGVARMDPRDGSQGLKYSLTHLRDF